jgi:hypothetical protein
LFVNVAVADNERAVERAQADDVTETQLHIYALGYTLLRWIAEREGRSAA